METLPNNYHMCFEINFKRLIFGNSDILCWILDVYIQFYGSIWQQRNNGNFPWTFNATLSSSICDITFTSLKSSHFTFSTFDTYKMDNKGWLLKALPGEMIFISFEFKMLALINTRLKGPTILTTFSNSL